MMSRDRLQQIHPRASSCACVCDARQAAAVVVVNLNLTKIERYGGGERFDNI